MKFNINRIITKVHIPIIRICNQRCPNCCARHELTWYNKNLNKEKEVSLEELKWAGELLGYIPEIEITGGEPTLHSQFEELTNNLRNYFNYKKIMLVSNGFLFGKDPSKLPLLLKYDRYYFTHYTNQFDKENKTGTNTKTIEMITEYIKKNIRPKWLPVDVSSHIIYGSPPYPGRSCERNNSNMISYYEGKLYGCCIAWSLENKGIGIPLTKNWRNELHNIELPCESCFLSV